MTGHPVPEVIDPLFHEDPWDAYRWLHANAPVYLYDPRPAYPSPMWILSRWDDIRFVETKPDLYCNKYGVVFQFATHDVEMPDDPRFAVAAMMPNLYDPPEHSRHRRLVRDDFRPSRMYALEEPLRKLVNECLDTIEPGEASDFSQAVAYKIPLYMVCDLLGVGRERAADFMRWSHAIFASFEPGAEAKFGEVIEMFDFFEDEIADRRKHPKDDLITDLVQARHDGEGFTKDEMIMWCWVFLVAGQDTTACLLAGGVRALLAHPGERARLVADPSLVPGAVHEMLRWVTPTHAQMRTATTDTELRGQKIAAGDKIYLCYTAANRDPEAFPDPYRFDVGRNMDKEHLSFGFGQHYCLGAPLARLEGRVVFEELLARFPNFEAGGDYVPTPSAISRFPGVVPVRFLP
jgi:cytochrome P450